MTEKTALLLNELTPAQKNYVTNRLAAKKKEKYGWSVQPKYLAEQMLI